MSDLTEFQERMRHLNALLDEAERESDPASRSRVQEIVRTLMDLHGAALSRLLELIDAAGESGAKVIDAAAHDGLVSPLLLLYGMHPLSAEDRVRGAMERISRQGIKLELLSISQEGALVVRMQGDVHGCAGTRATLRQSIEQEILAAAPEVTSIAIEGIEQSAQSTGGFVPLDRLAINGSPVRAAS